MIVSPLKEFKQAHAIIASSVVLRMGWVCSEMTMALISDKGIEVGVIGKLEPEMHQLG